MQLCPWDPQVWFEFTETSIRFANVDSKKRNDTHLKFVNTAENLHCARPGVLFMMPCMIDPRDLASAIKELRGRRTQREVAKRARIDPATWNAYEKGVRNPRRPERLRQIAEGLGVEVIALQNAITEQSARRMAQESSRKVSRDVSYKNPPLQARTDLNEMCRLVEEEMAEITRHLTKLILLIMEGRPRNS